MSTTRGNIRTPAFGGSEPLGSAPHRSPNRAAEGDLDQFSTLFSPATPRASPTSESIHLPIDTQIAPHVFGHLPDTPGSADSEFGAFVSVPPTHDPLSSNQIPTFSPLIENPSSSLSNHPVGQETSHDQLPIQANSSLRFFDRIGRDAKTASEQNKRNFLDELLMHEDDPMYWLKHEGTITPGEGMQADVPGNTTSGSSVEDINASDFELPTQQESTVQGLAHTLDDLDLEYFSAKPASRSPSESSSQNTNTRHPSSSPSRSATLASLPTLAPPISTPSSVSPSVPDRSDPLADLDVNNTGNSDQRSASYQTLSHLSSRWMPTLLNAKALSLPTTISSSLTSTSSGTKSKPPLEGLFSYAGAETTHHDHQDQSTTLPFTSSAFQISHGTPFGSSKKSSPFASHVYAPPSGAPGYKGEEYDWDKGYSDELEREMKSGSSTPKGQRDMAGSPSDVDLRTRKGREQGGKDRADETDEHRVAVGSGVPRGVSQIIEKRVGGVELIGRKASTVEVLPPDLAGLIRPHLPALARLPKSWSLLYSLDQHGISLKTLYARCEAQTQVKPGAVGISGALVVIKDAGDTLFGAWVGDGIRMNAGKRYYGTGESFLWRYRPDHLEVYKWTGKNDYIALCEPDFISFGGGDGQYGLYLDETLIDGSSARCPTFDNQPLCSAGPRKAGATTFECVGLEVWGVGGQ